MRTVKRISKRTVYVAGDKVRTSSGEGIIKHVYPRGPHGKSAYCVSFSNRRAGVIFSEDEVIRIEKCSPM